MHQIAFGGQAPPGLAGEAYPQTPSWMGSLLLREGMGREGKGRRERGRGGRLKGWEGKGGIEAPFWILDTPLVNGSVTSHEALTRAYNYANKPIIMRVRHKNNTILGHATRVNSISCTVVRLFD